MKESNKKCPVCNGWGSYNVGRKYYPAHRERHKNRAGTTYRCGTCNGTGKISRVDKGNNSIGLFILVCMVILLIIMANN